MNRTISLALGAALLGSVLVGPAAAKPAAPHPTSAFAFVTADTPVPGTITSVDIMASGLKKRYAPADQATTLTVTAPNNNGFVASFVSDAITVRVPAVDGTYTMIFATAAGVSKTQHQTHLTDKCPFDAGVQPTIPDGWFLGESGYCQAIAG